MNSWLTRIGRIRAAAGLALAVAAAAALALAVRSGFDGTLLGPQKSFLLILFAGMSGLLSAHLFAREGASPVSVVGLVAKLAFTYLALELMLWAAVATAGLGSDEPRPTLVEQEMVRQYDWGPAFLDEVQRARLVYEDYTGVGYRPFQGRYIDIDARGVRRTSSPARYAQMPPDTLLVFGGSTIWGYTARDEHTIPSQMSRLAAEQNLGIHIENRGVSGHAFAQEIIELILLLKGGARPEYVVFYDGANEVYNLLINDGVVGRTHHYPDFARVSAGMTDVFGRRPQVSAFEGLRDAVYRLVREASLVYRAYAFVLPARSDRPSVGRGDDAAATDAIDRPAREAADWYRAWADLLERLSASYGFRYLCFWQPVLPLEPERTEREQQIVDYMGTYLEGLAHGTYRELLAQPPPRFIDLTDALRNRDPGTYLDFCHTTEEANRVIAEEILRHCRQDLFTQSATQQ